MNKQIKALALVFAVIGGTAWCRDYQDPKVTPDRPTAPNQGNIHERRQDTRTQPRTQQGPSDAQEAEVIDWAARQEAFEAALNAAAEEAGLNQNQPEGQ